MSPADELLVERWTNSSDADAFGEIVARHARMVYATSLRITRNHADAEDVAQECFLALAKGTNTIKFSLPGWLHRLATRRSLDVLRSVKRRRAHENVPTKSTSKPGSAETSWSDIQAYVDEAIAALPEKLRDPVVAHFLEGQSYQAVGEALGLHRSTVAHRVQRALELIRRVLKRRGVRVTSTSLAALFVANGSGAVVPSSNSRIRFQAFSPDALRTSPAAPRSSRRRMPEPSVLTSSFLIRFPTSSGVKILDASPHVPHPRRMSVIMSFITGQ
jgi:RNA polymerase sigma factor (sigma-70 family)